MCVCVCVIKSCVEKKQSTGNPGSFIELENTKMSQIFCGSTDSSEKLKVVTVFILG